jgi:hypothetical protein
MRHKIQFVAVFEHWVVPEQTVLTHKDDDDDDDDDDDKTNIIIVFFCFPFSSVHVYRSEVSLFSLTLLLLHCIVSLYCIVSFSLWYSFDLQM